MFLNENYMKDQQMALLFSLSLVLHRSGTRTYARFQFISIVDSLFEHIGSLYELMLKHKKILKNNGVFY